MLTIFLASLLTLSVTPQVCSAPCDMYATIRVQPDASNTMVVLHLFNTDGYERRSEVPPSQVMQIRYPDLPEGDYTLSIYVMRKQDGKERRVAEAQAHMVVR